MGTETELKLTLPPKDLRRVGRLAWLRKLASGPAQRRQLVSVYFDTDKFKLQGHGITLRIRKIGRKRIQTIKAFADGAGNVFSRREWEAEIKGDAPDFQFAKDTALEPLLTAKLKGALRPVFETNIERTTLPLRVGASLIELAIDKGFIRTGRHRMAVAEIELELKKGKPKDLVRLAKTFARLLPVAYGVRAKAERGYALSAGERSRPVEAQDIALSSQASVADAFIVIGFSCLHHFAGNEEAVRNGACEGVHQMRVGLRRLRAAISLFQDVVQGPETDKIKAELRWLTEQLGPARDLDVFVKEGVAPLRKAVPERPEIALLKSDLEVQRDEGFAKAKAAVRSARYRKLVLRTALWLAGGKWLRDRDALMVDRRNRRIGDFAAETLNRRTGKLVKKIARLESLDARGRHKLRIAAKKLRYATEFFAGLFAKKKARGGHKAFYESLKALQDALGKLNDIVVHERLAEEYARSGKRGSKRPAKAFAMGMLTGREQLEARSCLADAIKAGTSLSQAPRFWR